MIQVDDPAPVAIRVFSNLMGLDLKATQTEIQFGADIGMDYDDGDTASMSGEEGVGATQEPTETKAQPFLKSEEVPSIRDWLVNGLGKQRGVLSAWPCAAGLPSAPTERVLLLSRNVASGFSNWWIHKFKSTLFSKKDSYRHRATNTVVYRVGGSPEAGWNWFPRGVLYGLEPGAVDAFLHFGLVVTVKHLPVASDAPALGAQVAQAAVGLYLELEAATHGIAPPVFAAMLVFNRDTPAGDTPDHHSSDVIGTVVASQLHTFRLSDMLAAYNALKPEENRVLVQNQIQSATLEIFSKIQRLAASNITKLNICAANIVFCPHLAESEGDDWVLMGFGFKTADYDLVSGKPHLAEYDPRFCKRMTGQSKYDPNCALVLMVGILLAAVRAEFGSSAATLMLRALLNQDPEGIPTTATRSPLTIAFTAAAAAGKAEAFRDVILRAFQHSRIERDAVPSSVFDEIVAHAMETLAQPVTVLGYQPKPGQPPRFHQLVMRLVNTRSYSQCDPATADELALDQVQDRKHRMYTSRVLRERQERIRARLK